MKDWLERRRRRLGGIFGNRSGGYDRPRDYDWEDGHGRPKSRYKNRAKGEADERARKASEEVKNRRNGQEPERAKLDDGTQKVSKSATRAMEILDEQPRLFGLFTTRGGIEARAKAFNQAAQDRNFYKQAVEEPSKLVREHPKLKNNPVTHSDAIKKRAELFDQRINENVLIKGLRKVATLNGIIPFGRAASDINFKYSTIAPWNYVRFWSGGSFKTPIGLLSGIEKTRKAIHHWDKYGAAAFEDYTKKNLVDFLRKDATHHRSKKELDKAERELKKAIDSEAKASAKAVEKMANSNLEPRLVQRMAESGNPYARTVAEIKDSGGKIRLEDIRSRLEKNLREHVDNPRASLSDFFDDIKNGEKIFLEERAVGHKLKEMASRDFHPEQLRQLEMSDNPHLNMLAKAHHLNLNPETIADELHDRLNGEQHVTMQDAKQAVSDFDTQFEQSRIAGKHIQQATRNINDTEFISRLEASSDPYLQTSGWAARAQLEGQHINGDNVLRDLSQRLDSQTPLREADWENAVSRFEAEYAENRAVADAIRQDAARISDPDFIHQLQNSSNPYHQTIGRAAFHHNFKTGMSESEIMRDLDSRLESGARSTVSDLRQAAQEATEAKTNGISASTDRRFETEHAESRAVANTIRQDAVRLSDPDFINQLQNSSNPYHQTIGRAAFHHNFKTGMSESEIMRDLDSRLESGARSTVSDLRQAAKEADSARAQTDGDVSEDGRSGDNTGKTDSAPDKRSSNSASQQRPHSATPDTASGGVLSAYAINDFRGNDISPNENAGTAGQEGDARAQGTDARVRLDASQRAEVDAEQRQTGPITRNRSADAESERAANGDRSTGSAAREYDGPLNDNMRLSDDFPDTSATGDTAEHRLASTQDADAAGHNGHLGPPTSFLKKLASATGPVGEMAIGTVGFLGYTGAQAVAGRGIQQSASEGFEFGTDMMIGVAATRAAMRGDEQAVWENVGADIGGIGGAIAGSGWWSIPVSVGGAFVGNWAGGELYEDQVFFRNNDLEGIVLKSYESGQADGVALGQDIRDFGLNPIENIQHGIQDVQHTWNEATSAIAYGWDEYGNPALDATIEMGGDALNAGLTTGEVWLNHTIETGAEMGEQLRENAGDIAEDAANLGEDVGNWTYDIVTKPSVAIPDTWDMMQETASAGWDGVTHGVQNPDVVLDPVGNTISTTVSGIGSTLNTANTWFHTHGLTYANDYFAEPVNDFFGMVEDGIEWSWNNPDDIGWGIAKGFQFIGNEITSFSGWIGGVFNGAAHGVTGSDEADRLVQYRGQKQEMVERIAHKQKEFVNQIQSQESSNGTEATLQERIREITGKDMPPEQALRDPEIFAEVFDDYVLSGNSQAVQLMTAFAILETKRGNDEDMIARVDHYLDQHPELDQRFDFATFAQRMQDAATSEVPDHARPLLDKIAEGESNGSYNAIYGQRGETVTHYGETTSPTNMTIEDVLEYQSMNGNPAFGRYQFKPETLREMVDNADNINMETKFTEATQDQLAFELLKQEGYYEYVYGNGTEAEMEQFLYEVSGRWAAVPHNQQGEGRYDHMDVNDAHLTYEEMQEALLASRDAARQDIDSRQRTLARRDNKPEDEREPEPTAIT